MKSLGVVQAWTCSIWLVAVALAPISSAFSVTERVGFFRSLSIKNNYDRAVSRQASQFPLENLSSDKMSDDEREFVHLANQEMLRQAEEEHRRMYEQHRLSHQSDADMSWSDTVLKNSHVSFKNVEQMSENLFSNQPLVALAIFVSLGCLVAYFSGLYFLDGYISSPNPALNGGVPYWDEQLPTDEETILMINTLHDIKDKLPSLWFWD